MRKLMRRSMRRYEYIDEYSALPVYFKHLWTSFTCFCLKCFAQARRCWCWSGKSLLKRWTFIDAGTSKLPSTREAMRSPISVARLVHLMCMYLCTYISMYSYMYVLLWMYVYCSIIIHTYIYIYMCMELYVVTWPSTWCCVYVHLTRYVMRM